MKTTEPRDPRIGTVLDDKLEIKSMLGRGGMGVVYLSRQLSMDRDVAVKVLHPHALSDEDAVKRFLHEAKVASKLRHPNIITVFDFGQTPHEGVLYLVMELLSGAELAEVVEKEGALPPARVVHIMTQVCDAVHSAHQAGLVHRDLKPENVFLTDGSSLRGDFVKVLDFGIARAQAIEGADRITRTGVMCGTPAYMSPEQIMGDEVDARTDVYSLGIMLFELLTGKLPYSADTQMRLLMAHLESKVPPLDALDAAIPPAIYNVASKAMAKKPADRYTTALDLANALVEALEATRRESDYDVDAVVIGAAGGRAGTSGVSKLPTAGGADRGSHDTIEPLHRQGTTQVTPRRSRRWLIAAAAVVALGGGGTAVVLSSSGGGGGDPVPDAPPIATVESPPATPEEAPHEPPKVAAAGQDQPGGHEGTKPAAPDEAPASEPEGADESPPAEGDEQAPEEAPPAVAPTIALTSEPTGAMVTLDGEPLGTTPLAVPRPEGDEEPKLRIKLAGYETVDLELSAEAEDIDLTLEKKKKRPTPVARDTKPTRPPPSTPPPAEDKKPSGSKDGAGLIQ